MATNIRVVAILFSENPQQTLRIFCIKLSDSENAK
jgi:hypothetical protein